MIKHLILILLSILSVAFCFDQNDSCYDKIINHESISAFNRARSESCKAQIRREACLLKEISAKYLYFNTSSRLQSKCPFLANFTQNPLCNLQFEHFNAYLSDSFVMTFVIPNVHHCKTNCFKRNYKYLAFRLTSKPIYSNYSCVCFNKIEQEEDQFEAIRSSGHCLNQSQIGDNFDYLEIHVAEPLSEKTFLVLFYFLRLRN